MEPLPASFYGEIDRRNPVIATFENEMKQFLGFMRKLQRAPPGDGLRQEHRRGSSTLFHIWVKYKPRLPTWYYQEKLLKVGDGLVQINEHKLALFQCYERYLEQFFSVDIDDITDVDQFKSTFFPSGTNDKKAALTFHALQGRCICIYQLVKTSDANLQNEESVKKCLRILAFLQLIMQVVLPQEHLCWLIFNGTLYIYTICRHLMVLGHSSQALEFLLWASICMESSVPLLSVQYLTWRAALYTAVCQCYFDCQEGIHGEVFARRALGKINELSQLENMSDSSYNEKTKKAFKESTLKMAVMIFKRAVFESRRKPKGILRPKVKNNLKEAEKLPWPRTNTERLLMEMFGNNASQFLAIIEALADSNRRVFQAGPPVPDEPEIHDVIAELFFAGIDILSGGGHKAERGTVGNPQGDLDKLFKKSSLLELAVEENNAVSAEAAVKFSKLSFSYENWVVFDALVVPLFTFLKAQESTKWKKEEMDLRILLAAEPLLSGKKHNHSFEVREDCNNLAQIPDYLGIIGLQGDGVGSRFPDDSRALAEMLFSCVCNSVQEVQPDRDIVIDVVLYLWQKCKTGMQRIHTFAVDGSKFIQKCEMSSKWIYILCLIYEVMQQSNIIDTDAAILGEAALKLAGIAESMADAIIKSGNKSDRSHENVNLSLTNARTKPTYLKTSPVRQLMFAYETLDKAIKGLSVSRSQGAVPQHMSVVDHYITMLGVKRQHGENTAEEQSCSSKSLVNNVTMMDLQLELIVAQHRVSVKLHNQMQVNGEHLRLSKNSTQNQEKAESLCFFTETEILDKINKNKLSKAIFLMQKAVLFRKGLNGSPNKLLEDSQKLIQQAEVEENAVYLSCIKQPEANVGKVSVPPPPILLCRAETLMVFKPAPFKSNIKVAWYCIFGQSVTGPNLKARLNDHHLPGTGEEVPANSNNLFVVKGLKKNEKYIFAVAAYSEDGRLIGDMIGESTKPILAFPPLSVPATWAYLAQSAYLVGNYNVAKKACSALWNYFVLPAIPPSTATDKSGSKDAISQMSLCHDAISNASPILLQLFLGSIFTLTDINIKEKALYCDSVCDGGILRKGQICRIAECERLLVALDVSSLLSDASYALQTIVQCYGLIAPVIYHQIPSVPVVQILIKCLAVLQEIPSSTWQKKQAGVTEGILHMTACMVYYIAKVLRSWEEYEGAISVIEIGKKLLDLTDNTSSIVPTLQSKSSYHDDTVKAFNASNKEKGYVSKKYQRKKISNDEKVNEHLSVLEYNLLQLTKPLPGTELTGQEDPILLHAVVSCWSLNAAFKEVMKFKKNSRFLEFSVQLLQRALYEEKLQKVLEWTTTVFDYLKRRNKNVLGNEQHEDKGDVPGLNDSFKRYTAALVEYQKGRKPSVPNEVKKKNVTKNKMEIQKPQQKKKNQNVELHRLTQEELEKKAFTALLVLLTPIVGRYIKRKRRIQVSIEEMPWRAQMNILVALTHFSLFKRKLSQLCSEEAVCVQSINSYIVLNPELFTLHHAGTVVMATDTNAAEEQMPNPGHLHPSLRLALPPDAKLTDSIDYSDPSTIRSDMDTPRTQMTNDIETPSLTTKEQAKINMSSVILLNHLEKICIHLKRAVVLAHRGGHWTLLQNASRLLWNLALELQLMTKQFEATEGLFPITRDHLNKEIWMPFYFAADMMLDMLVILQNNGSLQIIDEDEKFSLPSCMGGIADEEGGSNLTFEHPFDDVTVIDMRWIRDLVLKAIEVLYNMNKWEALVHVAVQFNLISHERFTEQVTPVLVHAQRMLAAKIFHTEGSKTHFNGAMEGSDGKMKCRNYIGKPFYVGTRKRRNPGEEIDHRRHIGHSDDNQLEAHTRVPIDVMDTFACFRDSLQKSKYSSRALKHSRKLLTLFLAYSQGLNAEEKPGIGYRSYGKVGFSAGALLAHRPVPPDLSEEEFLSLHSIANNPIPPSHLSVVIASYDKTIGILHSDRQQSLKAQALHELGNLHLYTGNKRAAFKCWCQALDETLNMSDTLNSWQELDSSPDSVSNGRSKDYCEKFVSRAGIWGCLLAAVITAKMSRYIFTSDIRKKTECCLLSALLFKSLFYVSLPHPDEDRDYALYEIGEGCEVPELIPGIDLFSDQHRADAETVVSSLGFLTSELHSVGQSLMVLPLFTLYQYFAGVICRDTVRCVEARILKIKVLTDLYLFAEAFRELFLLNIGIRIPLKAHKGFTPAETPLINHGNVNFSSSHTLLCRENLQAVEEILNRKPNACLLSLCAKTTIDKLVLAKTHFVLKLSSTINAIPEEVKKPSNCATGSSTESQSETQETVSLEDNIDPNDFADTPVQLTAEPDLSLPKLKDILLSEAEGRVTSILKDLEKKYNSQLSECAAVDLEVAVEAKLQLCTIAQQRHYTAVSVAMAFSALTLLQEAKIYGVKIQSDSRNVSPSYKPHSTRTEQISGHTGWTLDSVDSEARERLNIQAWLRCRFALVTSLIHQMPGIATHDQDMLDSSAVITEGIVEAETLNDYETQAHFLLQAAFLDIQDGHPRKGVQLMLENIIHLLQGKCFISPMACLTLAQSLILSADLMENNEDQLLFWTKQLNIFTLAHKIIVKQLTCLEEIKEQNVTQPWLSSSLPPFKNMYLPQISLLAKVRMRIGHVLTLQVSSIDETSRNPSQLLPSLTLYNTALELCRNSSFREYDLEAELLFLKGKTERLMFILGDHDKSSAVKSFSEAIHVSCHNDQNFSLIRKSYLEIALVYLHMCSLYGNKINNISSQILKAPETTSSKKEMNKVLQNDSEEKAACPSEFYRLLAWIAIRAATQVGEAMLAYKQLLGSVAVQTIRPTPHERVPTFACMDLLGTYQKYLPVDGQKYADEEEGTLRSAVEGKQDQSNSVPIETLSWVHVIRYQNHLMRLKAMLTLTDFSEEDAGKASAGDTLYTSVFDNGITVRCVAMHLFLKNYLYPYSICCVNDFPPELLLGLQQESKGFYIEHKINSENEVTSQDTPLSGKASSMLPDCGLEDPSEQMATHAVDRELCLQWYLPTSERKKNMVLLIYAYNKQKITVKDPRKLEPAAVLCGCSWISLPRVLSLHEKLCVLRQKAELSLQPASDATIPEIGGKLKRSAQTARNKSDLKPVRITEDLQLMILQCCSDAQALLSSAPNPPPVTQAPFDITVPSLIRLERVFDLTHGCMLMKGSLLDWTASQFT